MYIHWVDSLSTPKPLHPTYTLECGRATWLPSPSPSPILSPNIPLGEIWCSYTNYFPSEDKLAYLSS